MPVRFVTLIVSSLLLVSAARIPAAQSAAASATPVIYTAAKQYAANAWIKGAERFPLGAALVIKDEKGQRPLIKGFSASADANVSFDAKHLLFAGKRQAGEHWQIWEMSLATREARQITHCAVDCVRPFYLPQDRLVYAHKLHGRFVIEVAPLAGKEKPIQIAFAPGNFFPTDILRDGRVLFQAAAASAATAEIFTVYTDGSGVESYRCDHGTSRFAGKQVSSGDVVFAHEKGLARFTSALAHEVVVPAPAGSYAGDVVETSQGNWLLSWRADAQKPFELKQWKPGASKLDTLISEPDANVLQPTLLESRVVPNRHPTGLHDWTYANLLCLNAYTSKTRFDDASIATVRIYTRDASGAARLLGAAPVEKDGSFYVRVPGDQPLKIELLDKSGKTLKKEAGWFWARAGEQRACVGCHAGPETSPENAVPAVLLRSTVPADMTAQHSAAGGH